ncbi:hypothetical protein LCGC14_0567960 [marine sediment metagenome]|uniref:Uncharacterized protein n=1 Tax=marine sediment metagenome TaxID=412755 RepID=A0A0F9U6G4_9ZZZZ
MIDKILKAARKVAADHKQHTVAIPPGPEAEELLGASGRKHTHVLIETDVEAFEELVRLASDYFNPGRAAGGGLCKKCGAPLLWVKTTSGANAPLDAAMIVGIDADGVSHRVHLNHFSTCPRAAEVTAEQKAHAAALPKDGKTKAAG